MADNVFSNEKEKKMRERAKKIQLTHTHSSVVATTVWSVQPDIKDIYMDQKRDKDYFFRMHANRKFSLVDDKKQTNN